MSSITDRFKKKLVIDDKSTAPDAPPKQEAKVDAPPPAPPKDEIAELKAKLAAAEAQADLQRGLDKAAAYVAAQDMENKTRRALQAGNIITPPDQPKSDPKLAADPVPGFSPIPEPLKATPPAAPETHNTAAVPPAPVEPAPKGRGRPPGAKNKPKDETPAESGFTITRVKVSLGATVKADPSDPKCFEFLRADVGLEADVVGDLTAARRAMADQCAQALAEELDKLKPSK